MNNYELKVQAKRERYQVLAQKNHDTASALYKKGSDALSLIPFGQPILVGHHSERADRAYRGRAIGAIDKSFETSKKADYYDSKAESVGTGGISSDDPDAIPKLKSKVLKMEQQWAEIKRLRKEGKDTWAWGVSTANIRSTKKRIEQLEKASQITTVPDVIGDGYILRENKDENRIQFIFEGKPSDAWRSSLKRHGFRWSPTNGAWQAFLSNHGRYSAECVIRAFAPAPCQKCGGKRDVEALICSGCSAS